MTMPGAQQLSQAKRLKIARLVQLHHELHPARLGPKLGLCPSHIRAIWSNSTLDELPDTAEALELLRSLAESVT